MTQVSLRKFIVCMVDAGLGLQLVRAEGMWFEKLRVTQSYGPLHVKKTVRDGY
jgi:hypothetical protein